MCRHVAYWGPPAPLAPPVLDAPHSLSRQCLASREMPYGCDNLDGWGFGWVTAQGTVQRYRSALPLTEDEAGRDLLRSTRASRFVVHVRQKTPGGATDETGSAPFTDGSWLFTHNGAVDGFREGARDELVEQLSPRRRAAIEGDADSEVLFALVLDELDRGATPVEALRALAGVAQTYGGRYNVVLLGADALVATRWDNTLYVAERRDERHGMTISSEPLDGDAWSPLDERSMVVVDHEGIRKEQW